MGGAHHSSREPRLYPIQKPLPSLESRSTTQIRSGKHDTTDTGSSSSAHHSRSESDQRTTNGGQHWLAGRPLHAAENSDRSEEANSTQRLQPVKSAKGGRGVPNFHLVKETAL